MKRSSSGAPVVTTFRTTRHYPLSCYPCREKKRRCDRNQPCSNCSQRNIVCEYEGRGVITKDNTEQRPALASDVRLNNVPAHERSTLSTLPSDPPLEQSSLLPPISEARKLFEHFATALHPGLSILHIPSARELMEETYRKIHSHSHGDQSFSIDHLLLLLSIFAGATSSWTSRSLETLDVSSVAAKEASEHYTILVLSILNDAQRPVPSTTATICAIATLAHVVLNSDNPSPSRALLLRSRFLAVSRTMQLHKLDTFRSREERKAKGANLVDIEVQRRVWWHMVASDWLGSFSEAPYEGVYTFNKRQMNVRLPANVDDELVTPLEPPPDLPLSTPTAMTYFLLRVRAGDICREIVDTIPPIIDEFPEPNYQVIMDFDKRFQDILVNMPESYRLDPQSVQRTQHICHERPYILWQRIVVHFSLHSRICRLHRPYHLEAMVSPKYSYSRDASIRSARKILELRRMMDDEAVVSELRPERSWVILRHVTSAALALATDVSNNPGALDAEAMRQEALEAYRVLESSKSGSSSLMKGIGKSLQTIMANIHTVPWEVSHPVPTTTPSTPEGHPQQNGTSRISSDEWPPPFVAADNVMAHGGADVDGMEQDTAYSSRLWSEFLATVPDLDSPQWTLLLQNLDGY
ncbi:putative transcriptional regulatory protein-like protein [Hapsidospora chrysogenum ATCC 11550]|uniref:Putative transcriptional regulatory protein-like protein n=1 Tax=Hapsidospora chrysogenum (strain ATCC 11550 / CBS 779.69 / DSM 880 / IAM 14645 / JCM 23072 / IMI 49137) TaxID=857340 RepID=A0A086SXZ7_HAPC1|nr:putative transcriptional regulatory protein-like protein [Hapsidospora chrysogenum ATCC 11550]